MRRAEPPHSCRRSLSWMPEEHPAHNGAGPKSITDTTQCRTTPAPIKCEEPDFDAQYGVADDVADLGVGDQVIR